PRRMTVKNSIYGVASICALLFAGACANDGTDQQSYNVDTPTDSSGAGQQTCDDAALNHCIGERPDEVGRQEHCESIWCTAAGGNQAGSGDEGGTSGDNSAPAPAPSGDRK